MNKDKSSLEQRLAMLVSQREAMINASNVKQAVKLLGWIEIVKKQLQAEDETNYIEKLMENV